MSVDLRADWHNGEDFVADDFNPYAERINEHDAAIIDLGVELADVPAVLTDLDTTVTGTQLNGIKTKADAVDLADLTKLHALVATAIELNYVDGVTSSIQTQLDTKTTLTTVNGLISTAVSNLINGAPGTADTLKEISDLLTADEGALAALTTVVGNKQPIDATLTALAGTTVAADTLIYGTGTDTFTTTAFTTFARTLVAAANAAGVLTALSITASVAELNYAAGVTSAIQTQLNAKRALAKRVGGTTSSATPTPDIDSTDLYILSAQTVAAAFANPTGTWTDGQHLSVRVKAASALAITWGSVYLSGGDVALPSTTIAGKTVRLEFEYDSAVAKLILLAASVAGY